MIVVMHTNATQDQIRATTEQMQRLGLAVHRSTGVTHTVLGGVGHVDGFDPELLAALAGVRQCFRITSPYKLASREFKPAETVIRVGPVAIGGPSLVVMAGPCCVESAAQMDEVAAVVAAAGATIIRGGAFKPRSSPYSFQGLGVNGLQLARRAADRYGLLVISEVMDIQQVPVVAEYADVLQVGARNMQNFNLLRALGEQPKPVLLKRGMSATLEELLLGAEYIMTGGNYDVMLCERGIRTFETSTRNTMDIAAIPVLKLLSHLPVIADPSHGTGRRDTVVPMARAAVAAGGDGLLIEVHNDPDAARCDGAQSLYPGQFVELMNQLAALAPAVGRRSPVPAAAVCHTL
jgi:3-deoxy-7-phosphoheptulonate synthase